MQVHFVASYLVDADNIVFGTRQEAPFLSRGIEGANPSARGYGIINFTLPAVSLFILPIVTV